MKYYIDFNYPGVSYVVPDDIAEKVVSFMAEGGAALKEEEYVRGYNDVHIVTGIRDSEDDWGLNTIDAEYYGDIFIHDGCEYAPGYWADIIQRVYKTEDDKFVCFDGEKFIDCGEGKITKIEKPMVTVYYDWEDDEEE